MTVCQYRIVRDIIPGFPNMVFIIQLNVGGEVCMKLCKSQTKHFHSVLKRIVRYAATAKSLQSCPTLCDAIDGSPPGSPVGFSRQEHWSGLPFPSPMHASEK